MEDSRATEQSGWGGGVLADGKTATGMCSWNYLVLLKWLSSSSVGQLQ